MSDLDVRIRPAGMDDLDALVSVHTAARSASYRAGGVPERELGDPAGLVGRFVGWSRTIQIPEKTALCAVRGKEVVGVLAMGPPLEEADDGALELYQIHVAPGHWRRGIGRRMHAAYVRALRAAATPAGLVSVWERNERAQAFYTRQGWRPDGRRKTADDGLRYLRLRLELTPA